MNSVFDEKQFPSYVIIWLVLFFLMIPGYNIIPNVDSLNKLCDSKVKIDGKYINPSIFV